MNYYEKIVILNPNLDDSTVGETVEKIKDVIIKHGGEIYKTENWGRRKLAYELNKHQKGNYIFLLFQSPPTTILELEKFCKVVDSVIKFMVVKLTNKKQIESLVQSPAKAAAKDTTDETKIIKEEADQKGEDRTQAEEK